MTNSIKIKHLGELKNREDVKEWLISEPVPVGFFDGMPLTFTVVMKKELDGPLLEKIENAVESFLKLDSKYKLEISKYVYENYQDMLKKSDIEPLDIDSEEDVWGFVYPNEILIDQRSRRDEDIYIQVICDCEWEEEHGLQFVFKKGEKVTRVSDCDGHITEADAYDKPDSEDKLLSSF